MRFIIWFMALIQLGSCAEESKLQESPDLLVYESSSRGYFYRIEVNLESIKVYEDRSMKQSKEQEVEPGDWKDLLILLDEIDLEQLGDLEVSTSQGATDRSAIATITRGASATPAALRTSGRWASPKYTHLPSSRSRSTRDTSLSIAT